MINGFWNWGKKFYCDVQFSFLNEIQRMDFDTKIILLVNSDWKRRNMLDQTTYRVLCPHSYGPLFHPGKGPCFICRRKIRTVQISDSVTFVTEKRQNIKSNLNGKSFSLPPKLFEQETISFTVKSCSNQFYCLLCNKSKMNTALRWKLHQHFLQFHHYMVHDSIQT